MSQRPWRASSSLAACATCFLSATSSWTASASPSALSFFSASRFFFSVRPEMTTRAPALTSSCAPDKPMPDAPPVIQATFPSKTREFSCTSALGILRRAEQVLLLLLGHFARAARVLQHFQRALHRGALEDRVAPAPERGVLVDFHSLALGKPQPRYGGHVGDRVLV